MSSMLLGRLCHFTALKVTVVRQLPARLPKQSLFRMFSEQDGKEAFSRAARRKTLKEKAMAPPSENAYGIGKGALAGGAALGIGALAFYGLGLSNEPGAVERSMVWPQYVKERIHTTYLYFGGSLAITAASAYAAFHSPLIMNMVTRGGFLGIALSLAAIMGTGMLAQSIEYSEGFGAKQMAWILHSGVLGAMLAPMCFMGGPILIRAALYTGGIVGGLSTIAVCAPSEKFLMMGGPLAMGLGAVFIASLAGMWLPPTTALGAGLYSISLYGDLLVFSGLLLYDTQKIIAVAEKYPPSPKLLGYPPFDPINQAISIYLDTINIFIRIATLLAGGGGQRKR